MFEIKVALMLPHITDISMQIHENKRITLLNWSLLVWILFEGSADTE